MSFEDLPFTPNWVTHMEDRVSSGWDRVKAALEAVGGVGVAAKVMLFLLYNVFFFYAVHRHIQRQEEEDKGVDWCGGLGFLIILTVIAYVGFIYFKIIKPWFKG